MAITSITFFLWPFDNPAVNRNVYDGSALRILEGLVLHDDVWNRSFVSRISPCYENGRAEWSWVIRPAPRLPAGSIEEDTGTSNRYVHNWVIKEPEVVQYLMMFIP